MPTAEPAQQRALLAVQTLDTTARQVAHRGRSLPEHAELADLGRQRSEVAGLEQAAARAVADLEARIRQAERGVQEVRDRLDRHRTRLDAGQGTPKDLTALQHEIQTLTTRQATLEDAELEIMEELETAAAELAEQQGQLAGIDARIEAATTTRDRAQAEVDRELADLRARRAAAADPVDPALIALYEKVAARNGGVAAAELAGSRCGACRMELSPIELNKVRGAAEDAVVQCEECGAILVR